MSISDDGTVMTATVANVGIYISTDSGATWNALSGIEKKNWNSISCNSTCSAFAVTNVSGNLFILSNQGVKIADATNASKWTTVSLSSGGTQAIAGASSGSMRRSVDSGANWSLLTRVAL